MTCTVRWIVFKGTLGKFRKLDQRISTVAHTAVRIGHSLETVDQQKERTLIGRDIIQHFISFNNENEEQLDPIFHQDDLESLSQVRQ